MTVSNFGDFYNGTLKVLRLKGPVVSEFAFWTSGNFRLPTESLGSSSPYVSAPNNVANTEHF